MVPKPDEPNNEDPVVVAWGVVVAPPKPNIPEPVVGVVVLGVAPPKPNKLVPVVVDGVVEPPKLKFEVPPNPGVVAVGVPV